MNPIGAYPYSGPGWPRPNLIEPEPDDPMPVVLVCGSRPDDLRRVQGELTNAWRRIGQPIVVCVSMWEARHPVGRAAHAWVAEHAFAGNRWHAAIADPGPVREALVFGPVRYPAAGWIPEVAA